MDSSPLTQLLDSQHGSDGDDHLHPNNAGYIAEGNALAVQFYLSQGGGLRVSSRTKSITMPCWRWLNLCRRTSVALSERMVGKQEVIRIANWQVQRMLRSEGKNRRSVSPPLAALGWTPRLRSGQALEAAVPTCPSSRCPHAEDFVAGENNFLHSRRK
jgi:hypothetical protein